MDDGRTRPSQKCWHNKADTLARPCGCKAQHMLGAIVPKIVAVELPQHHTIWFQKTGGTHLIGLGPARRAISLDILGFTGAPDRHANGNGDGDEAA